VNRTAKLSNGHDALVIGAGPAGVVAARSLADAGLSVLVLEAGTGTDRPPRDLFAALPGNVIETALVRRTRPQAIKPYLLGTGVGGGSRVNGLLFDGIPNPAWPLTSVGPEHRTPFERIVVAAAIANGMEVTAAPILGDEHGRWHSAPLLRGVDLVIGCSVDTIDTTSTRPVVLARTDNGPASFESGVVVVAAGALTTPRLLKAAGCASPRLGRGLADHPSVAFRCAAGEAMPTGPARASDADRFGPVVRARFHAHGRTCMLTVFDAGDQPMVLVTLLDSRSRGVLLESHAELNLLDDTDDRRAMRDAVRRVAAVLAAAFEHQIVGPDGRTAQDLLQATDDDLDDWIARNEDGTYHATGTAAMGASPEAVADLDGRVRGLKNVWVADASAIAAAPIAAPMAAVMYVASAVAGAVAASVVVARGATQNP
jgi:GMC oxidoreductase/FAD binding domain